MLTTLPTKRPDASSERPEGRRHAASWLWFAASALLGAAGVVLALLTARAGGLLAAHDRLLAEILVWWVVWAIAAICVRRSPRRPGVILIVVVAVGMRLASLSGTAPLSDDLYRYAWDARVQASAIDPYRYQPAAAELTALRDPWLWPAPARCARLDRQPGCTRINRPGAHTIYPPLAEAWFTAVGAAGASGLHDVGWELAGMSIDLAVVVLLLVLLRRWRRNPLWSVVYAWSPLAVLEAVQNAHVDALATLFVLLAADQVRRRPALAAGAVSAAALVKLYPLLVVPALLRRHPWRVAAVIALCTGAAYLPHVLAVGAGVVGYLPGYLQEEQYGDGSRYLLVGLLGVHGVAASVLAAVAVGGTGVWIGHRVRRGATAPDTAMRVLFAVALLVATPVQPWYGLSLAALAALSGEARWLALGAAADVLYFAVIPAGANTGAARLGQAVFAAAGTILVAAWWRERRVARRATALDRVARTEDGAPPAGAATILA